MKILLCGGGTAGHVLPIILVAEALRKNPQNKILYIGSRQGIEKEIIKKYPISFRALIVGKRRNYFSLANFWDILKTLIGLGQSFFILLFFRPQVVFAKGGFATLPIIFWLRFFKIPLVIHESDVVIGKANLWASKTAKKICLGFPIADYRQNLPQGKLLYTGIPVDAEFAFGAPQKENERLQILITGGSQGSEKINHLIKEILGDLLEKYEVWHVAGKGDFENLQKNHLITCPYYHLFDFTDLMPQLVKHADLVITRAGASTLAEISAASKAAIIIPLSGAAQNHQEANAAIYASGHAAIVYSEDKLTPRLLEATIKNLLDNPQKRNDLGARAKKFYRQNSVDKITEAIFEVASND